MHGLARGLIDSMMDQSAPDAATVSFDEAFTLHYRAVYAAARAVLRDSALAEDVAQEAFLTLYRNPDIMRKPVIVRSWLFRVTLNLARNTIRGRGRAMSRDTLYQSVGESRPASASDEMYETQAELAEVRRALDKIDEPMRSCLLLKYQGLSYREIAMTLSLKESSIGNMITRGRQKFARIYQKIGARS